MDDQGQRSPQIFLVNNFAILLPRRKQDDRILVHFQVENRSRIQSSSLDLRKQNGNVQY